MLSHILACFALKLPGRYSLARCLLWIIFGGVLPVHGEGLTPPASAVSAHHDLTSQGKFDQLGGCVDVGWWMGVSQTAVWVLGAERSRGSQHKVQPVQRELGPR